MWPHFYSRMHIAHIGIAMQHRQVSAKICMFSFKNHLMQWLPQWTGCVIILSE